MQQQQGQLFIQVLFEIGRNRKRLSFCDQFPSIPRINQA